MGYYFDDLKSIYAYEGTDAKAIINSLAHRYLGQNLEHGLYYRAYCNDGITRGKDYRYHIDLNKVYPDAKQKDCVWAFTSYYANSVGGAGFDVNCSGPMVMYLNGEVIYKSDIFKERYSEIPTRVDFKWAEGWNDLWICFKKTKAGFGGDFGPWLGKWDVYTLMPTAERAGQEGWVFTEIVPDDYVPEFERGMNEKDFDKKLYPTKDWSDKDLSFGQLKRIYGTPENKYAVGWTKGFFNDIENTTYTFTIDTLTSATVYLNRKEVYTANAGKSEFKLDIPFGTYDIHVKAKSGADWGFTLKCDRVEFVSAARVKGAPDAWMYIGPFDLDFSFPWDMASDMHHVIGEPKTYWKLDAPKTSVRPYNENTLFGRWNYPLGVTMYGLLHTALITENEDLKKYLKDHVQLCCDTLEYALWDKEQYGGATAIHNLLTSIDSLDDCGSFASMMLEVHKYLGLRNVKFVADYVGDYIYNKQDRLPSGAFYRKDMMHSFHNQTMWADDLYMSVPFLTRYYEFTGDIKYADDAANQFLAFKDMLYMEDQHIMSHVYDFKYNSMTGVPWGRGNGWVVFSMTELLEKLPEDHPKRPALLEFLNDLCSAYADLQDDKGMWHQVITDHESYPETSCTSMFIYAFSRGVRFGWLKDPAKYVKAIFKGWEALAKTSVDGDGNVYGVCRGSEFSFIPDYYKYELGWNLNDTHGTGIVMLAGIEVIRITDYLNSKN